MLRIAGVTGEDVDAGDQETFARVLKTAMPTGALPSSRSADGAILGVCSCPGPDGEHDRKQPFRGADGVVVVADARFDNRDWLVDTLGGQDGEGASTAGLIALAYRRWGLDAASRLEGDFAFLLWDPHRRTLVCARDGFGVRPLYFARVRERLWVASGVEQLLQIPGIDRSLNDNAVLDFVLRQADERDATMFDAVSRVRPAHQVVFRGGLLTQHRFWQPKDEIGTVVVEDATTAFVDTLRSAVRSRIESEHRVWIYLSGGLDSSGIAVLADHICGSSSGESRPDVVAGSASFSGLACDESRIITEIVARFRHLRHVSWDGTRAVSDDFDCPDPAWPGSKAIFAGGSTGDLDLIRDFGARVLITGDGGNEMCSDRAVAGEALRAGQIWPALRDTLFLKQHPLSWRFGRLRSAIGATVPSSLRRIKQIVRQPPRPDWLAPRLTGLWTERQARRASARPPLIAAEHVVDLVTSNSLVRCIEEEQNYASRLGAEMRYPYLDRRVLRVSASLTRAQRESRGRVRGFQRRALNGLVPTIVLQQPVVPLTEARNEQSARMIPKISGLVESGEWFSEAYVTRRGAASMLRRIMGQRAKISSHDTIWNMARRFGILEAWLRRLKESV